jgi:hypothetical protein
MVFVQRSHHGVSSPGPPNSLPLAPCRSPCFSTGIRHTIINPTSARSSSATIQLARIGHQTCRLWRDHGTIQSITPSITVLPQLFPKIYTANMQPQKLHRDEVAKVCYKPLCQQKQHENMTSNIMTTTSTTPKKTSGQSSTTKSTT